MGQILALHTLLHNIYYCALVRPPLPVFGQLHYCVSSARKHDEGHSKQGAKIQKTGINSNTKYHLYFLYILKNVVKSQHFMPEMTKNSRVPDELLSQTLDK